MDFDRLTAIAEKNMKGRRSHRERELGFTYYHGQRVARSVIALRKRVTDDETHDALLRCAAMFHDVGKGYTAHGAAGAEMARYLLKDELTEEELSEVCRLIFAHDCRAPGTDEWDLWAKLLQDADLLDHFGTVETWMNFHVCAYEDAPLQESVRFYREEYPAELKKHRAKLNFEVSKAIFDDKAAFTMAFAERMAVEARGDYAI